MYTEHKMKITEKEYNATTGEETITEREISKEELAEREAALAERAARQEAEAEKATAKAALLAKLSITEDEARLLLG
jgi:hypothetical protein